jgi:hypothetical protein
MGVGGGRDGDLKERALGGARAAVSCANTECSVPVAVNVIARQEKMQYGASATGYLPATCCSQDLRVGIMNDIGSGGRTRSGRASASGLAVATVNNHHLKTPGPPACTPPSTLERAATCHSVLPSLSITPLPTCARNPPARREPLRHA